MSGTLNKVMLIGRLGQDPKLSYTPSGTAVAEFSLATDESYTDRQGQKQEKTEWHRVKVWDRMAETCARYLAKGRLVFVEGKLTTRKWQDQQGQDRYITEIVAQKVTFLERAENTETHRQSAGNDPGAHEGGRNRQGGHGQTRREGQARPNSGHSARTSAGDNDPGRFVRNPMTGEVDDLGPAFPSESGGMDDVPF